MKLELIRHAGKTAGYNFVPENPAEENALKEVSNSGKFPLREYGKKSLQFIHADYALHDIKSLTKLGEISLIEVREEPEEYLVCSECGSKNVQVPAWVSPNNQNSYAGEIDDDAWCEDCEEHVDLDLVKNKKRKGKKNE